MTVYTMANGYKVVRDAKGTWSLLSPEGETIDYGTIASPPLLQLDKRRVAK